ncbi:MAG TPA: histidine phosphatase family protein [Usitatibacteraceae bacterium]|nr:histidine phosphatase family protein [Usitatibacteraceae bacterium]
MEQLCNVLRSLTRRAFVIAVLAFIATPAVADEDAAWAALRAGGHVALMRHASTEAGLGDPAGYNLDDCATQRNLSAQGREEARRIGERFRREGVVVERAYSSPWCRCRDTAYEAFRKSEDWTALASFFDEPHREPELTKRVKMRIGGYSTQKPKGTIVMVTHNVNIAALTGLSVGTGEIVVLRPDGCCGLKVVGRIAIR